MRHWKGVFIVGWLLAAELVAAQCFDFKKKNFEPVRAPIALNSKNDVSATGEGRNGVQWGAVRGIVKHHIVDLLKRFDDPYLTKNRKNTTITSVVSKDPHYLWVRKMHLVVKPVFFVTVEWDEHWAMALREGTPLQPKSLIVYYQKVAGTSHLEHLCGNIVVNFIDAKTSDVYLYEEVKAAHWSSEDAVKNFLVVLKIFRGEHKDD